MLYFDTSFLAPLILEEPSSDKVEAFIAKLPAGQLFLSQWTRVEFSSLIAREVRIGGLAEADYELAKGFVQHFATKMRAGDARHLATARNHGAKTLHSLDEGLLAAAKRLKVPASRGIKP